MKKLLATALALVTACAALAGCGDSDSSSKAATESKSEDTTTTTTAADESVEDTTTTTEATTTTTTTEAEPEPTVEIKYDPEATETVLEIDPADQDTGAWANALGVYFDANTFPADTDLTFTVEVQLTKTFVGMMDAGILVGDEQIGFAPSFAHGWAHFGETYGNITADFPVGADLLQKDDFTDGTYKLKPKLNDDGTVKVSKNTGLPLVEEDVYMVEDDSQLAPLYCKPDGFIKWNDQWKDWGDNVQTCTFTVSKDVVNQAISTIKDATDPAEAYDGILLQCSGNFTINKVTIDHGNILTNTQYLEWLENAGEGAVWGE